MKKTLFAALALAAAALCMPGMAFAETTPSPSPTPSASPAPATTPASPSPTSPAPAPRQTKTAAPTRIRARVLHDCEHGKPNDLVTLDSDVAAAAEEAGQVDTSPAAAAYAATLPQNQPKADPAS